MTIPVLKPVTEIPILPQPQPVAPRSTMTVSEFLELRRVEAQERARRDGYKHRLSVAAGNADKTRFARAMTGGVR